jgi:hypothetical protein
MGQQSSRFGTLGTLASLIFAAFLLTATPALAGGPFHARDKARDISGLNDACGAAVDSKGDLYAASPGQSKVKIFNEAKTEIGSISNANEPCGLAVDSKGNLYVSERASGNVLRYHPTSYPFSGAPSYEAPSTVDASGKAKGISVDPYDDRLYVAEGDHVSVYDSKGALEPMRSSASCPSKPPAAPTN